MKKLDPRLYNENKIPFGQLPASVQRAMMREKLIDIYEDKGFWVQLSIGDANFDKDLIYRVRPAETCYDHNIKQSIASMTQKEIEKCVLLTRKLTHLFPNDPKAETGTVSDRLEYMIKDILILLNDFASENKELNKKLKASKKK